jgi:hypothetical protein
VWVDVVLSFCRPGLNDVVFLSPGLLNAVLVAQMPMQPGMPVDLFCC